MKVIKPIMVVSALSNVTSRADDLREQKKANNFHSSTINSRYKKYGFDINGNYLSLPIIPNRNSIVFSSVDVPLDANKHQNRALFQKWIKSIIDKGLCGYYKEAHSNKIGRHTLFKLANKHQGQIRVFSEGIIFGTEREWIALNAPSEISSLGIVGIEDPYVKGLADLVYFSLLNSPQEKMYNILEGLIYNPKFIKKVSDELKNENIEKSLKVFLTDLLLLKKEMSKLPENPTSKNKSAVHKKMRAFYEKYSYEIEGFHSFLNDVKQSFIQELTIDYDHNMELMFAMREKSWGKLIRQHERNDITSFVIVGHDHDVNFGCGGQLRSTEL